jgi:hypothetical protein
MTVGVGGILVRWGFWKVPCAGMTIKVAVYVALLAS